MLNFTGRTLAGNDGKTVRPARDFTDPSAFAGRGAGTKIGRKMRRGRYEVLKERASELKRPVTARIGTAAVLAAGMFAGSLCHATAQSASASEPEAGGNARAIFKFGFNSYRNGNKDKAFEAYRDAADHGHQGARWKLANMYAAGDGIAENDLEAFRLFEGIVNEGADPGTQESTYVANALVSLGNYLRRGIPESSILPDARKARDLYWQAAANFGEPNAQFELGRMFLTGEGGTADERQAARWFNLAAEKGHVGAKAMLGHMLFEHGKHVRGLSMMTGALQEAKGDDKLWIRHLQEEAFAIASEADRRTAISLAETRAASAQ